MNLKHIRRPAALARVLSRTTEGRTLARELAGFTTPSDRLDLETLLDERPAHETRDVRVILARLAA
jgi:hypothetical protein